MTELPHKIREKLPQDAQYQTDSVAEELRLYAQQYEADMCSMFSGKFGCEIKVASTSERVLNAAQRILAGLYDSTPLRQAQKRDSNTTYIS